MANLDRVRVLSEGTDRRGPRTGLGGERGSLTPSIFEAAKASCAAPASVRFALSRDAGPSIVEQREVWGDYDTALGIDLDVSADGRSGVMTTRLRGPPRGLESGGS